MVDLDEDRLTMKKIYWFDCLSLGTKILVVSNFPSEKFKYIGEITKEYRPNVGPRNSGGCYLHIHKVVKILRFEKRDPKIKVGDELKVPRHRDAYILTEDEAMAWLI